VRENWGGDWHLPTFCKVESFNSKKCFEPENWSADVFQHASGFLSDQRSKLFYQSNFLIYKFYSRRFLIGFFIFKKTRCASCTITAWNTTWLLECLLLKKKTYLFEDNVDFIINGRKLLGFLKNWAWLQYGINLSSRSSDEHLIFPKLKF
jgi:hypothetical protein